MSKKYLKFIFFLLPSMSVVIFGFNNCGALGDFNGSSQPGGSTSSSSTGIVDPTPTTPVTNEVDSEQLGLPYALLSAEQTLSSMIKVTNLSTTNTAINNEYNVRYSALAAGNDLSMVNGPLLLGSTSLAGEVCNSMLAQEMATAAAQRNFFGSINFSAGIASVTDAGFEEAVRGMARSFWGRNVNPSELAMLKDYKVEFNNALVATARTQAASSSNLMLSTCAAMLSAVDAISY